MLRDFTTDVTGWFFLAGALLLWGGWVLLPRRVGMFFQSDDFPAISTRLQLWLWLYRVHLFGGWVLPWWVGGGAAGLGVAAMALTMLWPDNWALYTPVFHLQSLWLAATGAYLLLYGIGQGM